VENEKIQMRDLNSRQDCEGIKHKVTVMCVWVCVYLGATGIEPVAAIAAIPKTPKTPILMNLIHILRSGFLILIS
jgi:hypothetical protein